MTQFVQLVEDFQRLLGCQCIRVDFFQKFP